MEKLLYFAAQNAQKAKRLSDLAALLRIEFVEISPLQCGQQLGYLAGVDGFLEKKLSAPEAVPCIPEEMLILCGIQGERLQSLLDMLRKAGISVSLKAVMTAFNVRWTPAALYQELCAERAQLHG